MNLVSGHVMGAAALLTAPTMWEAFFVGSVPIEVALTRFLIVAVIAWLALSAVTAMIETTGPRATPAGPPGNPADDSTAAP